MRAISVLNMKGGVGKTTTAVHLAAGLAKRGSRGLLFGAGPPGKVGHTLNLRNALTLRECLLGEVPIAEAIIPAVRPRLDVVVSTTTSFSLERQLAGETQRETIMRRRLRGLDVYDFVIVDTSPAMS